MPPCRPGRRKFGKFSYEMVHSKVYLNKDVVSAAPFSYPAFTSTRIQKTGLCCIFSLFNFSSIFPGGSADSICPCVRTPMAGLSVDLRRAFTLINPASPGRPKWRQWDVSHSSIIPWVETIHIPRAEGCGSSG